MKIQENYTQNTQFIARAIEQNLLLLLILSMADTYRAKASPSEAHNKFYSYFINRISFGM